MNVSQNNFYFMKQLSRLNILIHADLFISTREVGFLHGTHRNARRRAHVTEFDHRKVDRYVITIVANIAIVAYYCYSSLLLL